MSRDCSSRPGPAGITGRATSPGVRIAKRELGGGTRALLDQLLFAHRIAPVGGDELHSHLEIALSVACGVVDVGSGLRSGAHECGLEFIPLLWEHYDIALPHHALGAAAAAHRAGGAGRPSGSAATTSPRPARCGNRRP